MQNLASNKMFVDKIFEGLEGKFTWFACLKLNFCGAFKNQYLGCLTIPFN